MSIFHLAFMREKRNVSYLQLRCEALKNSVQSLLHDTQTFDRTNMLLFYITRADRCLLHYLMTSNVPHKNSQETKTFMILLY